MSLIIYRHLQVSRSTVHPDAVQGMEAAASFARRIMSRMLCKQLRDRSYAHKSS